MITSPGSKPAISAGLSGSTSVTSAPGCSSDEHDQQQHEGNHYVRGGAGEQCREAGQPGRRVKATLDGRVALACRAHKAAEREPVQRVLGAVAFKQRQHARRIADAELLDLDLKQPRDKKVPQLVEEDEGADDENEG